MAGLSDLLSLSGNALRAHQSQISVHSNNIANVNTEGYSRRTQELSAAGSYDGLGMGVQTGDVTRYYNAIGTAALLQEQSTASYHTDVASYLSELEALVGGTVGSLDSAIEDFQNALQEVVASPEDLAARTVLLQRASTMASEFNQVDGYVQGIAIGDNPVLGSTSDIIADINSIAERLQMLNEDITRAQNMNRSVPDMLDERDALVRELSTLVNIEISPDYTVRIGGQTLVSADGVTRRELNISGPNNTFSLGGTSVTSAIAGGKLAALVSVQETATTLRGRIDSLASTLIAETNAIFDNAYNLNGESPSELGYTFFNGPNSQQMSVDTTLYDPTNPLNARPDLVAVAATRATAGIPNPGDSTAGQAMYDLLQAPQTTLGGQTISSYWTQVEATLGGAIREAEQLASTSQKVVDMLDGSMQSVSGVNLDEELINLTTAQRAYEAAARVMSTASNLLDILINQTR
jgi:flagellar hook-associated protein 1 FlgK